MKKMFIDAYIAMFGSTKKQANEVYKNSDNAYKNVIVTWFNNQSKAAFYND